MFTRLVRSLCLVLAMLFVASLMAGCAANLPCDVSENQVEEARAEGGSAGKDLQQAEKEVSELEAQVADRQATVAELEAAKAELEKALAE